MTAIHDSHHPDYLDEAAVRTELTRAFSICDGCRQCTELCGVFPTLFDLLDRFADRDPGRLTPVEQDEVIAQCRHCGMCVPACPNAPGVGAADLDLARLMVRSEAMRRARGHIPGAQRRAADTLARRGPFGAVAAVPGVANAVLAAPPGSARRRVVAAAIGISAQRVIAPVVRRRFSTWFRGRGRVENAGAELQGRVALVPTCVVEHHRPETGRAAVAVLERNRVDCVLAGVGCCGAPLLQAGDVRRFRAAATANVAALAAAVRSGREIVVVQPACAQVITRDYVDHVGGDDAALVAAHTIDVAQYVIGLHRDPDRELDTEFTGQIPATITMHASCRQRARGVGLPGRDLLELTGAAVEVVDGCSGTAGTWGLRSVNESAAAALADDLGARLAAAGGDAIAGECLLANTAITESCGSAADHPLELLARAYGIADEEDVGG